MRHANRFRVTTIPGDMVMAGDPIQNAGQITNLTGDVNITLPAPVTAGNALMLMFSFGLGSDLIGPDASWWTWGPTDLGTMRCQMFWKFAADGTEQTVQWVGALAPATWLATSYLELPGGTPVTEGFNEDLLLGVTHLHIPDPGQDSTSDGQWGCYAQVVIDGAEQNETWAWGFTGLHTDGIFGVRWMTCGWASEWHPNTYAGEVSWPLGAAWTAGHWEMWMPMVTDPVYRLGAPGLLSGSMLGG